MAKERSNDSDNNGNSSSEEESKTPEVESTTTIDYEEQRRARIAANNARMASLGLRQIANSLMGNPPISSRTRNSTPKSKRVVNTKGEVDDEYEPNCDSGSNSSSDDDEDFEDDDETFVRRNRKSSAKKVKNTKSKSGKQVLINNRTNTSALMDEDEALKQAIAHSLEDIAEISDLQHVGSSQNFDTQTPSNGKKIRDQFQEDNSKRRKRKLFTSRVQMTEDDLVIHFCQIDEVGKGGITLRDVERMTATHDFPWTDKELSDMIRCFDSDRDGMLTLDDLRNIAQRCNMLQVQQDS